MPNAVVNLLHSPAHPIATFRVNRREETHKKSKDIMTDSPKIDASETVVAEKSPADSVGANTPADQKEERSNSPDAETGSADQPNAAKS
jgi:hypothetical protein